MAFESLTRKPTVIFTTVTGTQNDLALGLHVDSLIEWTGGADVTITGLVGGVIGSVVTIRNNGSAVVFLAYNSTGSAIKNRLNNIVASGPTPLSIGGYATYFHDGSTWQLIAHEQGPWITVPFAAGNFTASGAMTWTVGAGNVIDQSYKIFGNTIIYSINVSTTTTGGVADVELRVTLPSTYICQNTTSTPCQVLSPGLASIISLGGPVSGLTYERFFSNPIGAVWGLGATAIVRAVNTFPII